MSALRRAFVAVVPPPAVLRWTESATESARRGDDGLRWTRADQRHLTLEFLGPVPDSISLVESVAESLLRIAPFSVALGGAGAILQRVADPRRELSCRLLGERDDHELVSRGAPRREHVDDPLHEHVSSVAFWYRF